MRPAATIGFRLHTGWAMLVAIPVEGEIFRVLHRCRIELLPPGVGRFVYHAAAELPIDDAAKLIESVRHSAETTAASAIRNATGNLNVRGACIAAGSSPLPDDLAAVLGSHPRIHAAEGALYAAALAWACERLQISLVVVGERDIWRQASESAAMTEKNLKAGIDGLRKTIGPPWTADHKIAMATAICYRTGSVFNFEP